MYSFKSICCQLHCSGLSAGSIQPQIERFLPNADTAARCRHRRHRQRDPMAAPAAYSVSLTVVDANGTAACGATRDTGDTHRSQWPADNSLCS